MRLQQWTSTRILSRSCDNVTIYHDGHDHSLENCSAAEFHSVGASARHLESAAGNLSMVSKIYRLHTI
jgi:hypothetical protein